MSQPPYGASPPPPPPYQPSFGPPPFPPPYPPSYPPPRKRRVLPVVIAVVVAVLLIAAAVLVPVLLTRGDDEKADGGQDTTDLSSVDTSNLDAVQEFEGLTNQHLAPGESHDYPQSPSVGGDHAPVWLECGVYDEPVPEVNAVHDLEHGTTWITYRPDLVDADGIRQLSGVLTDNGILSPYPDQEAPVVITVWGRQLELIGPEDPRIQLFITKYAAGDTAPEPFASCHGGVSPEDLEGSSGTAA